MTDKLADGLLTLTASSLDDLEKSRIAAENRYRSMTRDEADSDGITRGLGLNELSPEVARMGATVESLKALEHQTGLELNRQLRKNPLHGWVKGTQGVGERQAARLLAAVGDPYWNTLLDRPRTCREFYRYCGYGLYDGKAQKRQKGVKSNWNSEAKMRAYLIATSCLKNRNSPYRKLYDETREALEDNTELTKGHKHNRAMRAMTKAILRDLWVAARDLHEEKVDD